MRVHRRRIAAPPCPESPPSRADRHRQVIRAGMPCNLAIAAADWPCSDRPHPRRLHLWTILSPASFPLSSNARTRPLADTIVMPMSSPPPAYVAAVAAQHILMLSKLPAVHSTSQPCKWCTVASFQPSPSHCHRHPEPAPPPFGSD